MLTTKQVLIRIAALAQNLEILTWESGGYKRKTSIKSADDVAKIKIHAEEIRFLAETMRNNILDEEKQERERLAKESNPAE